MRFVCLTFRAAKLLLFAALAAAPLSDARGGTDGCENASELAEGYRLLTTKPYLPPDFDQEVFDELWKTWEEPARSQAAAASPEERRRMAFARYGLTPRPYEGGSAPAQYVVDRAGNWTMSCLACHQGQVAGKVVPGVPNSNYGLHTLSEEVRQTKLRLGKPLARMDLASLVMPLGTSHGTTNAVIFGVLVMHYRDAELNFQAEAPPTHLLHHDVDAPAWWHFKKKKSLYADGFAPKGHRPLMQFLLVKENGPEKFREWEEDFRQIAAWLESLEAPKYPFDIDQALAQQGELVFNQNCAECHGTYGEKESYPNRIVPIDEVATDPVRLEALTAAHRRHYAGSWIAALDEEPVIEEPGGYLAPPLDGIWATAPYLHNGSVPTLQHVLFPEQRPQVWRRTETGYDRQRVGLEVTEFREVPESADTSAEQRQYFDTRKPGKSAAGHEFPAALSVEDRQALLEYLKTL